MKKLYSLFTFVFAASGILSAQTWCTPTTAIPYASSMPGITHFTCNTIDRTSAACENYPSNSYVLSSQTTTLARNSTYTVTITFNVDASICPDMNLRLWIDYNQDGQLDDVGETVISADHQSPGTYTGTFTIPATATLGATRMRATAKMTSNGGHSLPTPCDIPADPYGYHGEFEDYNITIAATTGINEQQMTFSSLEVVPNPSTLSNAHIDYSLNTPANVSVIITNIAGQIQNTSTSEFPQSAGDHTLYLTELVTNVPSGMYFVTLTASDQRQTTRIVIQNE